MLREMGNRARVAAHQLARATEQQRNNTLVLISEELLANAERVLAANQVDIQLAQQAGLESALIDRLTITTERLKGIAADLVSVVKLPDPLAETFDQATLPNGLKIHKQRVPIGVLAVIYESRPNVTIDVAGMAIKTGNAAILRGGSETIHSNSALVAIVKNALKKIGLPADSIQFVDNPDRKLVYELLEMHELVDMLIPRGGAELHQFCRNNSRIPVITGGIGICHLYVDETANLEASIPVIHNAKVQRPTVCNALDTLLVHQAVADRVIPQVISSLGASGVNFRLHPSALPFYHQASSKTTRSSDENSKTSMSATTMTGPPPQVMPAGEKDFDTEWLALVLGIKVVQKMDEAIEHIALHSTGHSDGILTSNSEHARRFIAEVDSAAVYVNASTRFTDGGQLGLGAEVAISTQRLHARGPMGLRELTTYNWVI
jgi:glutamate-5-semialdehyde dehydrogenase